MLEILLVWPDTETITEFSRGLAKSDLKLIYHSSGQEAIQYAQENSNIILAAVAESLSDMRGLDFVKKLLAVNAMIGTAVASDLPHKEFHETSEGFGILQQLPLAPDKKTAKDLLTQLERIGLIAQKTIGQELP